MSQKPPTQKAAAGKAVEVYPASDPETALARGEKPDCSRRAAPAVWVDMIGNAKPIFLSEHPVLFSMPLAFLVAWLVSKLEISARVGRSKAAFADPYVRARTAGK
jgi:hypothetical protein